MALERVPTGIEGLDRLIGGGLVRGSRTLPYGPPGSGKTVFGMQFAWEGIKREEVVSYDSLDRPFAYLRGYFDSFGWKIGPHESQGRFVPVQSFPHYATHQKEPHIIYQAYAHDSRDPMIVGRLHLSYYYCLWRLESCA